LVLESIKKHKLLSTAHYDYEGIAVDLIECQLLKPHGRHPSKIQAHRIDKIIRNIKRNIGNKFDKVFVHFPSAFMGIDELFAEEIPTIATFHNADIITLKNENCKCLKYVNKFSSWGSRSNKIQEYLLKLTHKQVHQIYSGIDESLLISKEELEKKIDTALDRMIIVYAGNLIPLKNVDILVEAVKKFSNKQQVQLRIIGDGQEEEKLKKIAGDNEDIIFLGRLSREETIIQMREANVFAMVSSPETFGLVYIESMGQGCITIGSVGEGIDGVIVDGENGYLVKPRNVEDLYNRLLNIRLLTMEEKERIILNAYKTASDMTDKKMAQAYFDAI
jgi:glycosyltransferase involved in cell wall biosynthesis